MCIGSRCFHSAVQYSSTSYWSACVDQSEQLMHLSGKVWISVCPLRSIPNTMIKIRKFWNVTAKCSFESGENVWRFPWKGISCYYYLTSIISVTSLCKYLISFPTIFHDFKKRNIAYYRLTQDLYCKNITLLWQNYCHIIKEHHS